MSMACVNGGECHGCVECQPAPPVCPVCGGDADNFYLDDHGNVLGCGECVRRTDAWEVCRQ